ncbi:MAG: hypothetical protein ACI4MK_03005 [Aristaeellaceae bacterium]
MAIRLSGLLRCFRWQSPSLPRDWFFAGRLKARPHRVVVDECLMAGERTVTQVCLPLSPEPRLSLRAGSGTLLLAAAMTVMADTVPDEAALLSLAATLGFTPDKFLRGCPVLQETALGSVPGRIVRDGKGRRAYYLGDVAALSCQCSRIWDGGERPMTMDDLHQIRCIDGDQYALATAPVDGDTPGEATYLGSLLVENTPCRDTLSALEALTHQGFVVAIRRPGEVFDYRAEDLAVTDRPTEAPCLISPAGTLQGLDAAVSATVRCLQVAQEQRRALWQTTLLVLLCGLIMRLSWQSLLLNTAMCALGCFLGRRLLQPARPRIRRLAAMLFPLLIAGLSASFMDTVAAEQGLLLRELAHSCLCLTVLSRGMCLRRWVPFLFAAGLAALTAIDALCFHAGLAAVFACLSGMLGAVVYCSLLRAA